MRGRGVAVVDVLQTIDCRADLAPVVDAQACFVIVDGDECRKLSIGDAKRTIRRAELNPVAGAENAALLMEDLDSGKARGIVADGLSPFISYHHLVPFRVDCFNPRITSAVDSQARTSAPESEHIADFVALRSFALGSGQIAVDEHDLFSSVGADVPAFLEGRANCGVQLAALVVGRADDENLFSCFMRGKVFARNRCVALIWIDNLADAALLLEECDCLSNFSARSERDRFTQSGIELATDSLQSRDGHARLLHLLDGPASLDGVVLALVADEDDPTGPGLSRLVQQRVHLVSTEQARLIDDPQLFGCPIRKRACEQTRHGPGLDAGFGQRFYGARGRSETAYRVASALSEVVERSDRSGLRCACAPFDRGKPISGSQRQRRGLCLFGG